MLAARFTRACAAAVALLAAAAVVSAAPATAGTQSTMSTKYIVNHLPGGSEHVAGYVRSKFNHWADDDRDG